MKKIYLIGAMALAAGLTSCDDFLDKKPVDSMIDSPEYWNIANNVEAQTNRLYNNYLGYGNGSSYGTFYFDRTNDDQAGWQFDNISGVIMQGNWAYTNIPSSSSTWNDPYTQIRGCNYIITNVRTSELSEADKAYFEGVARLNRAYQYYQLIKRYGNVVWVDEVLGVNSAEVLYGPRTNRDLVMDYVLADLQYAVQNIGAGGKTAWSSDMANAMLTEVALYEGTYAKYRTQAENGQSPDIARSESYLKVAVAAAGALINSGSYALEADYGTIYHSTDITGSKEVIFCKAYSQPDASFGHGTIAYTNSTTQIAGMTKDAFNNFLFLDGKPLATTTMDTNDEPVWDLKVTYDTTFTEDKKIKAIDTIYTATGTIDNLLAVRDKRMSVLIDNGLGFGNSPWTKRYNNCPAMTSGTGYIVKKFYTDALTDYQCKTIGQNTTQCPLYSYAPVLLAYAEAKAELGTITQADLDITINALNKRGGIPAMTLNPDTDPANNMGVSNLLWEIRRCRRCELMFDGNRYWDLVRWHQLQLLGTTDSNRAILQGANISQLPKEYYTNADGNATVSLLNGYINAFPALNRSWDPKYYFFPIPSGQLTLNPELGQNPGW